MTAVAAMEKSPFALNGKVALVTGGASGLGRRMCTTLAGNGAAVAVADINQPGAAQVAQSLASDGRQAVAVPLDVVDPQGVRAAVDRVISQFGRLDIAVNAAGVAGGKPGDTDLPSVWRHIIDVDLSGVYYCCLHCSEAMKRHGGGSIINIASMSATIVNTFPSPPVDEGRVLSLAAYCAAKAGVKQLTKVLAAQWAPAGIRVNCISPGYMATEMTRDIFEMPQVVRHVESNTPLRRTGRPEDLDGALLYLASPASSFMTGAELLIDGGYTLW